MLTSHLDRLFLAIACIGTLSTAAAMWRIQTAEYPNAAIFVSRFAGAITMISFLAIAGAQFLT